MDGFLDGWLCWHRLRSPETAPAAQCCVGKAIAARRLSTQPTTVAPPSVPHLCRILYRRAMLRATSTTRASPTAWRRMWRTRRLVGGRLGGRLGGWGTWVWWKVGGRVFEMGLGSMKGQRFGAQPGGSSDGAMYKGLGSYQAVGGLSRPAAREWGACRRPALHAMLGRASPALCPTASGKSGALRHLPHRCAGPPPRVHLQRAAGRAPGRGADLRLPGDSALSFPLF